MNERIICTAIITAFYILGAYATTDIIRLLKGSTLEIRNTECYCPICGYNIPLLYQLPIVSYAIGRGRCRNCHNPIPFFDIFFEIAIFMIFSCIAVITSFSWTGYAVCIMLYELIKVLCIIVRGAREHGFARNLIHSLINNLGVFALIGLLFFLYNIVI